MPNNNTDTFADPATLAGNYDDILGKYGLAPVDPEVEDQKRLMALNSQLPPSTPDQNGQAGVLANLFNQNVGQPSNLSPQSVPNVVNAGPTLPEMPSAANIPQRGMWDKIGRGLSMVPGLNLISNPIFSNIDTPYSKGTKDYSNKLQDWTNQTKQIENQQLLTDRSTNNQIRQLDLAQAQKGVPYQDFARKAELRKVLNDWDKTGVGSTKEINELAKQFGLDTETPESAGANLRGEVTGFTESRSQREKAIERKALDDEIKFINESSDLAPEQKAYFANIARIKTIGKGKESTAKMLQALETAFISNQTERLFNDPNFAKGVTNPDRRHKIAHDEALNKTGTSGLGAGRNTLDINDYVMKDIQLQIKSVAENNMLDAAEKTKLIDAIRSRENIFKTRDAIKLIFEEPPEGGEGKASKPLETNTPISALNGTITIYSEGPNGGTAKSATPVPAAEEKPDPEGNNSEKGQGVSNGKYALLAKAQREAAAEENKKSNAISAERDAGYVAKREKDIQSITATRGVLEFQKLTSELSKLESIGNRADTPAYQLDAIQTRIDEIDKRIESLKQLPQFDVELKRLTP